MESFYFLRHGQTDWNAQGLLMGQKDIPLNAVGRKQAHEAAKMLVGHAPASICHSPLLRAKETALIIADVCPCSLYVVEGLAERAWGSWEGTVVTPDQLANGEKRLPKGAEKYDAFKNRVLGAYQASLLFPQPLLFIAHSGVMRVVCEAMGVAGEDVDGVQPLLIHVFQQLGKWNIEVLL